MGTRADFYIGTGKKAEWIGSVAWDGYLWAERKDGHENITEANTEAKFREAVAKLSSRGDFTSPEMGWPWPWTDSAGTDYAYCFSDGKVLAFNWGEPVPKDHPEWPDMDKSRYAKAGSKRSGVMVFGA